MTDKQILFCKEYLVDLNATKAAVRAGYSDKTAKTTAHELMSKDEVAEEIQRLFDERASKCGVTSEQVLKEFVSIGMSNIKDYMDDEFDVKNLSEIPDYKAKAIKSIKKTVIEGEGFNKTVIEFQLHDKIAGLNNLGKHLGLFEKDNSQSAPVINNIINLGEGVDPNAGTST